MIEEQEEILKELETLIAARTNQRRPDRVSVAIEQCMAQFGLYSDFKMTLLQVNRVDNLSECISLL